MVDVVTVTLFGEMANWVEDLYSDNAWELGNVNLLLEALQCHFEDMTPTHRAERELMTLKQGPHQVLNYIQEFCQLADKLQHWPEQLLVHQFKLNEWYWETPELDAVLREFHPKKDLGPRPRRFPKPQLTVECTAPPMAGAPVRAPDWPARLAMLCFRCSQQGHRGA
ncbi:hypothetical protein E2320_016773, partial [Naja naja]